MSKAALSLKDDPGPALASRPIGTVPVRLTINGEAHVLDLEPWVTLLDLLRERLHRTGTKKAATMGNAGPARS